MEWCSSLGEGWRLPTQQELGGIVVDTHPQVGWTYSELPGMAPYKFWSCDYPASASSSDCWYVDFSNGNTGPDWKVCEHYVRACRSPRGKTFPWTRNLNKRFYVDERDWCIAVRDRKHSPQRRILLYPSTPGVIRYWGGSPQMVTCRACKYENCTGWKISDLDRQAAAELCALLNEEEKS
jgi:hypothetical protein